MARISRRGLLIVEDLGSEPVVDAMVRSRNATRKRPACWRSSTPPTLPQVLPVGDGTEHALPPYDLEALLIEVELLTDWYVPHIIGTHLSGSARAEFVNIWTETLQEIFAGPTTWTLRDYHSPNLIWLAGARRARAGRHHRFSGCGAWGLPPTTWRPFCRMPARPCRRISN